jgi:hypothetical protein
MGKVKTNRIVTLETVKKSIQLRKVKLKLQQKLRISKKVCYTSIIFILLTQKIKRRKIIAIKLKIARLKAKNDYSNANLKLGSLCQRTNLKS